MIKFLTTAKSNREIILYYLEKDGENLYLKANVSRDGFSFNELTKGTYIFVFDKNQKEEQAFDWKNVRIAKDGEEHILTYQTTSNESKSLHKAISADFTVWYKLGEMEGIHNAGVLVSDFRHEDQAVMYLGGDAIRLALSQDLTTWTTEHAPLINSHNHDGASYEIANAEVLGETILLTYYVKKPVGETFRYFTYAAYFDKNEPTKLLWQSEEPIYSVPEEFYKDIITPLGSQLLRNEILLYWRINDATLFSVSCPIPVPSEIPETKHFEHLVKKHPQNPIIAPRPEVPWESRATFNSAAIYEDGKVHFLYRSLGDTDLSVLGYATSTDGLTIDYRADMPAYIPREPFETPGNKAFSSLAQHFVSGGGYGGVEDPRITRVEDKVYLTYVAFDGATPPRAAISSISINDFVENNWDAWAKPKLISAPGMVNKSAVVLPRKVRGKYVVMHRVYPNILVDYLDDLEFNNYLQGHYFIPPRKNFWDSKKVGAGAPPIETKDGWLMIYQSVGYQDSGRYKIGAMMLDRDNPEKVLYRTHMPIIEPVEPYENNGFKAGVVYPCGSVIMNNKLFIYYGGADSYVNAATADVDTFLEEMKYHQEPRLHMVKGI